MNLFQRVLLRTIGVIPEMVNRKRDLSLNVHFLYLCHMDFATAPPFWDIRSSVESVHSYGRNERDHRL